ncbi:MAG: urease accessory protein UreD [Granulosicoccus sp.]
MEATEAPDRQRVNAAASVSAKQTPINDKHATSGIDQLYQQGSARIRFPDQQSSAVHAVLLNTAGGLTGDDHIQWQGTAGTGARLIMTTAACEKIYRTHGPAARQTTRLGVEGGSRLDWLPQESIAFNGSSLERTLDVRIAGSGSCLLVESVILGRQAMNEAFDNLYIHDKWRVYRNGSLLHAEDFRLDTRSGMNATQSSMLLHYSAISTLVLVAERRSEWFDIQKQNVLQLGTTDKNKLNVAVTHLPYKLVVRTLAINSFHLRQFLIPCIELLNDGEPIPAVWKV